MCQCLPLRTLTSGPPPVVSPSSTKEHLSCSLGIRSTQATVMRSRSRRWPWQTSPRIPPSAGRRAGRRVARASIRVEVAPGEEAQVDFGYAAQFLDSELSRVCCEGRSLVILKTPK